MGYCVRPFSLWKDIPFVLGLFKNPATRALMFDTPSSRWRYCFYGKYEAKLVCLRSTGAQRLERVGILNFSLGEVNEYWIAGAIKEKYYNSGIGVIACIAIIDTFFKTHPSSVLRAGTFTQNKRSLRLVHRLGFHVTNEDDKHVENLLTENDFNNDFVRQIRQRYDIH